MNAPLVLHNLNQLSAHIPSGHRVLILTSPRRRHLDLIQEALGEERVIMVFDQARVHVPREVVDSALLICEELKPHVILTLGGGAATGLGKALLLRMSEADSSEAKLGVNFMSIPTTYSGSEMTEIWGVTEMKSCAEGGHIRVKTTGRDPLVRPAVVVHDPRCLETLSPRLAVESLFNALAHPISALSVGLHDPQQSAAALRAVSRAGAVGPPTVISVASRGQ